MKLIESVTSHPLTLEQGLAVALSSKEYAGYRLTEIFKGFASPSVMRFTRFDGFAFSLKCADFD
jgi:hypothetical protein